MYASAIQYINQFGSQKTTEFVDRSDERILTKKALLAVVNNTDTSDFSAEIIAAATNAKMLINNHLNSAYLEINSYLSARYTLPLSADIINNSPLQRIECDIARYLIATSQDLIDEIIETRYRDAVNWLKNLSNAKAKLGSADTTNDTTTTNNSSTIKYAAGKKVDLEGY